MNDDAQHYLRMYQYLKLCPGYCDALGGLAWSSQEDGLVYPSGKFFIFNEAVAAFLEGFATGGRVIPFSHVLHWIDLLLNLRDRPEPQRVQRAFLDAGGDWRNAGAFAALLSDDVPEVPEPPRLEQVCYRLRDRAFPIRWYVARFHAAAEEPPLAPDSFEALILDRLAGYDDAELRAWFATGRGPATRPGKTLADEPPPPRTFADVLAALLERPRLAGAAHYVPQLVSAVTLPPRRRTPQELPVGGYSDMVTRGQVEHLLPSQHALDELEFLRRFSANELLFFRREEPPAQNKQELALLLDQGVRTWGDVRVVLAAAVVALLKQAAARKVPVQVGGTSNHGRLLDPHQADVAALGEWLEASDLSLDPGLALEHLLEQPGELPRDVVLLTHPRNLEAADVLLASRRLGPRDRLFALTLDRTGQAELREVRRGATVALRQFHVDLEPPPRAPVPPPAAPVPAGWTGDVEVVGFPFRFGTDSVISHFDFDHGSRHLLTASRQGLLHVWRLDNGRQEMLPRPVVHGAVVKDVAGVVGVAGGFVVLGRTAKNLVLAHYDLEHRRCLTRAVGSGAAHHDRLYYLRDFHAVVVADVHTQSGFACDLQTGYVCDTAKDGRSLAGSMQPLSWAQQAWKRFQDGKLMELGRRAFPTGHADTFQREKAVRPAVCYLNPLDGTLSVGGTAWDWPPFCPEADGRPTLKGTAVYEAQIASAVLALRTYHGLGRRPRLSVYSLLATAGLIRDFHEVGQVSTEGPVVDASASQSPPRLPKAAYTGRFLLAPDGRRIALERADHRVVVEPIEGPASPVVTRSGGFPTQVWLYVGDRYFMLMVGRSHPYWHLVDWSGRDLTWYHTRARAGNVLLPDTFNHLEIAGVLRRSKPVAVNGRTMREFMPLEDPERWLAAREDEKPGDLVFALDRYGQVAVFDARRQVLAVMFLAFRQRLAAWLPDGTTWGDGELRVGPATAGAAAKIAAALRAAQESGRGVAR